MRGSRALISRHVRSLGLSVVECYNKNVDIVNNEESIKVFVASMDVDSLYPSMKTDPTADVIRSAIVESDIDLIDLNLKELTIFLRKNMTSQEISESSFCEYIPTKIKKPKEHKKSEHKYELWNFPKITLKLILF